MNRTRTTRSEPPEMIEIPRGITPPPIELRPRPADDDDDVWNSAAGGPGPAMDYCLAEELDWMEPPREPSLSPSSSDYWDLHVRNLHPQPHRNIIVHVLVERKRVTFDKRSWMDDFKFPQPPRPPPPPPQQKGIGARIWGWIVALWGFPPLGEPWDRVQAVENPRFL
ncbi:hypothetical protein M501DRAFT_990886 [Patellaria atrata CBS 101060]|uniref:Uncharacterized protein n=1 Tax=Patellaria atrata CBS 101060 TaxID=1346257 RepID=A0A9P4SE15_9PEZI|nr:hypothetical protein M501DRAFT_990886 [Patellaria atrata CBS 101060]